MRLPFQMFDKLKEQQPNFSDKIVVIEGDIQEPNLGISDEDTAKTSGGGVCNLSQRSDRQVWRKTRVKNNFKILIF